LARAKSFGSTIRKALSVLVLIAFAWIYSQFRPEFADSLELGSDRAPTRAEASLRVVSWNLRRFGDPEHPTDLVRLGESLDKVDADLIALQEIMDAKGLETLRPEWETRLSRGGGRGHQHVGFWWNPARVRLKSEPTEIEELTMGGSVRPGLLATFESVDGLRFQALVVHLKAKSEGLELRRRQWEHLARAAQEETQDALPLIVLGDFNATGDEQVSARDEREALAIRLASAGLKSVPNPAGCSAYWQGIKRDAWLDASQLDLVWTRGFEPTQAWAGAHCGRHRCDTIRHTRAHPDPDYQGVSDHCPLVVDLDAR
jgi:endonuclease/exonuclease/phosphatase family metal-dependent hydrolase